MRLSLRVINSDIEKGEKSNPSKCAIARSIKRNKNITVKSVSVFHDICVVKTVKNGKTTTYRASMPEQAQDIVMRFDRELCVAPISFNLDFARKSARQAYTLN